MLVSTGGSSPLHHAEVLVLVLLLVLVLVLGRADLSAATQQVACTLCTQAGAGTPTHKNEDGLL